MATEGTGLFDIQQSDESNYQTLEHFVTSHLPFTMERSSSGLCVPHGYDSYPVSAISFEPPNNMSSVLGYFDAINSAGLLVDMPSDSPDRARKFRDLYRRVAAKRQKAALKQDQLMYELECLRHHLHFVDESQAELDERLGHVTNDVSCDKTTFSDLHDVHNHLRADHGRLQEQADKIISLGDSIHRVQAKLRTDEEQLADYTEALLRKLEYADLLANTTPGSSPEISLHSPRPDSSPDTTVGSPIIKPLDARPPEAVDAARGNMPRSDSSETTPSFYNEDDDIPTPPKASDLPEIGPPSPLVLGPPRLATPPDPLFSNSKRIRGPRESGAGALGGGAGTGSGGQEMGCMVK